MLGTRTHKRGDRRRRRTVGRINRGGGDGGEPVRSPPGADRRIAACSGAEMEGGRTRSGSRHPWRCLTEVCVRAACNQPSGKGNPGGRRCRWGSNLSHGCAEFCTANRGEWLAGACSAAGIAASLFRLAHARLRPQIRWEIASNQLVSNWRGGEETDSIAWE